MCVCGEPARHSRLEDLYGPDTHISLHGMNFQYSGFRRPPPGLDHGLLLGRSGHRQPGQNRRLSIDNHKHW